MLQTKEGEEEKLRQPETEGIAQQLFHLAVSPETAASTSSFHPSSFYPSAQEHARSRSTANTISYPTFGVGLKAASLHKLWIQLVSGCNLMNLKLRSS